jgi:type III pantothenate kinase
MILICDVGNTSINFGLCDDDKVIRTFCLKTLADRSSDEYIVLFKSLIESDKFTDVLISSVVPVVTSLLIKMFDKYYSIKAKVLGPGNKTGVMIKADNPREVGADLI